MSKHLYILLGEKNNTYHLVSKRSAHSGILPVGSFLTIEKNESVFVLYVIESVQTEIFQPSYLLADLDLSTYEADNECKNKILAIRIFDSSKRNDGLVDYLKPQSLARLSTNEEISEAVTSSNNGVPIFPSTYYNNKSMKIRTENESFAKVNIPFEAYWHQIQITGKTGSGKTVASKYLADHFISNKVDGKNYGCVLAINVKDIDFLQMDKATNIVNTEIQDEWDSLNIKPEGCLNYEIFYNGYNTIESILNMGIDNKNILTPITLSASKINPQALLGILQNLTNLGTEILPDIFRFWQKNNLDKTFHDFLTQFESMQNESQFYCTDLSGRDYTRSVNPSTANALLQRLRSASAFFETKNSKIISAKNILIEGKVSVINVQDNIDFGSIVLRYLLSDILKVKNEGNDIPILIIIDEVHSFYNSNSSTNTLGDLDTICRIGRSKKIGVLFSTQNVNDLPNGISQVINSKFEFKSDDFRSFNGLKIDLSKLKSGYSFSKIHGLPNVNFVKFPMSRNGVII
jgi:Cdc6-like AAA superfamily ATPase